MSAPVVRHGGNRASVLLALRGGSASKADLVARLRMTESSVSVALEGLTARGLAEWARGRYRLTLKGADALAAMTRDAAVGRKLPALAADDEVNVDHKRTTAALRVVRYALGQGSIPREELAKIAGRSERGLRRIMEDVREAGFYVAVGKAGVVIELGGGT